MFSILERFQGSDQASLLAMSLVVDVRIVSTMRRLLALRLEPVSVTSTMASTRRAFTSVAPHENSTRALMPRASRKRFVAPTSSVAMIFPSRSSTFSMGDS